MIVGITISNSQVYFLGFFLWKHSLQYVSNEGIYSVSKDLVKQIWQISQTECFASILREGLTRETFTKTPYWYDSSPSSHVFYTWLISRVSFSWNLLVHHFKLESSHFLTLILYNYKPQKYRKIWVYKITIKFGTELKATQNNCKSQLYNLPLWLFYDKTPKQTLDLNVILGT